MLKKLSLLILIASCVGLGLIENACTPVKSENSSQLDQANSFAIPELLTRPQLLGTEAEQAYVKESYNTLKNQIVNQPSDWDAHIKLAQLFMLEARVTGEHGHYYPAALTMVDRVLNEAAKDDMRFQASFLKSSVLLSLHKFEEAKAFGEQALAVNDHHALTYGTLVDAHVEMGAYEKAVQLANKMTDIRPDLRSYARVSYLREIHGDVEGAIDAMEMAIKSGIPGYEDMAWCRLTLGNIYESYGQLDKARMQYQLALEERPNYPFAIAALAGIELKNDNYNEAEVLLESACNIIPEVGFYQQKAALYQETGREEEAQQIVKEILVMLADDEASGHVMDLTYAEVYRDLVGDMDKALTYAQKEYDARPQNIDVNKMMASILYLKGDYQATAKHLDMALITGAEDPTLLCLKGLMEYQTGNQQIGKQTIEKALSLNPFQDHAFAEEARSIIDG